MNNPTLDFIYKMNQSELNKLTSRLQFTATPSKELVKINAAILSRQCALIEMEKNLQKLQK